jgi:hypothetical protein
MGQTTSHVVCAANPTGIDGVMTRQRGDDTPPKPDDDDAAAAEFIDRPENLPGDRDDKTPPKKKP